MSHFCLALLSEKISEKFYRQNWHFRYKVVTSSCFQGSNVSLFQFYFFFKIRKLSLLLLLLILSQINMYGITVVPNSNSVVEDQTYF